jgi:hypothetical protein
MAPGIIFILANALVAADKSKPLQIVLVDSATPGAANVATWKADGFGAVALVLDDRTDAAAIKTVADAATAHGLAVYAWIEVGRNPELARQHPEWMASLGMHADWRTRFPDVRPPEQGEVAKTWPWVPIVYKEAFAAHRKRVERLLSKMPAATRGVMLNDLQGGPSSCGCGNLQCRWAIDYHVRSTAAILVDAAPKFLAEVANLATNKEVIPVWTTECEPEDLPAAKRPPGAWGTGLCGSVPCFDYCRHRFAEQWAALQKDRTGPTAVLALHREFQRDQREYGGPAAWVGRPIDYCEKQGGTVSRDRLWLVVQGYGVPADEVTAARAAALRTGAGAVVVSRTRIDQSYEPRLIRPK